MQREDRLVGCLLLDAPEPVAPAVRPAVELVGRAGKELVPLMELLDRLDRYALSNKKAVTLALLRQMLAEPDEI